MWIFFFSLCVEKKIEIFSPHRNAWIKSECDFDIYYFCASCVWSGMSDALHKREKWKKINQICEKERRSESSWEEESITSIGSINSKIKSLAITHIGGEKKRSYYWKKRREFHKPIVWMNEFMVFFKCNSIGLWK